MRVGMEVAVLGHPKSSKGWVFTPGHMSSLNVNIGTNEKDKNQDGYMYTSATRGGSSGSPVILLDGSVAAVHKAGSKGFLNTSSGVKGSELTGFARGIRGQDARAFLVAQSVLPAR